MKDSHDPDRVLNTTDPGDDTLQRFRYQISYSAILGIRMLEDHVDIEELFCEHHEDILVKHADNTFTAVQVKTKDLSLRPFNIEDEAIKKSCKRFLLLEQKFPERFRGYAIVSNNGFDKTSPSVCITSLIDKLNRNEVCTSKSKIGQFIKYLSDECTCTIEEVIEVLKKIKLQTYSSLQDIHIKLVNKVKLCPMLAGLTESKIVDIADTMLAKFFKASSLENADGDCSELYVASLISGSELKSETIKSKKISRAELKAFVEKYKEAPVTIKLKDRSQINEVPLDHKILTVKMDEGNIDSENIDLLRDCKFSFEQHALSWIYKNNDSAQEKYNQVSLIAENLCKEIYDEERIATTNDGQGMLIKVRKAIKERQKVEPAVFFDCSYEHLLGAVGVLTENCKVWWSHKFELPK